MANEWIAWGGEFFDVGFAEGDTRNIAKLIPKKLKLDSIVDVMTNRAIGHDDAGQIEYELIEGRRAGDLDWTNFQGLDQIRAYRVAK